jgi:hypothetical protein
LPRPWPLAASLLAHRDTIVDGIDMLIAGV